MFDGQVLLENWEDAKGEFWHVIAHRPSLVEPCLFPGRVHVLGGQLVGAETVLEKMQERRVADEFVRAHLKFRLLSRDGQIEKASRSGREAIEPWPDDPDAHVELEWRLRKDSARTGEWRERSARHQVEGVAREALQLDFSSWWASLLLGKILLARR